ncbi:hypothetical protein [Pseudoalteromonas piscicida]|uniref:Uncharacterized protein n=1 Tax=Pseudoalteromonas piscicida TaxID=43662 RepID=A0A2A5JJU8_PSEO7|nr:hypothetical protein [Pseudoalteromonas piscicida]PCK29710.1 hypothetical protein CEX98_21300 [Pseudoalteromonas piscicida]
MKSNVVQFPQSLNSTVWRVSAIDELGKILRVKCHEANVELNVQGQLDSVCRAAIDDEVLLHSVEMPVVIGRLSSHKDFPAAAISDNNGTVVLSAQQKVCVKTKNGSIAINGNGEIYLEGKLLNADIEQDLSLQGWPIRLN